MLSLRFQETSTQHFKPKSEFKLQEMLTYHSSIIEAIRIKWKEKDIHFPRTSLSKKQKKKKKKKKWVLNIEIIGWWYDGLTGKEQKSIKL